MITEYGYTFGVAFLGVIWFIIFFSRSDLRRQILFTGLIIAPVAFSFKPFLGAYWNPTVLFDLLNRVGFSIEDLIFVFTLAGITSVLYELVTKKSESSIEPAIRSEIVIRTAGVMIFLFALFIFLNYLGLWKHLYSSLIPNLLLIVYICIQRKDLRKPILLSGVFGGLMYFLLFVVFINIFPTYFEIIYNLSNFWGINIVGIPLEEIIFGFHFSALMGGLYEYIFRVKIKRLGDATIKVDLSQLGEYTEVRKSINNL
jgi:hypothetical protein